jgi:hypothetical protein
MHHALGVEVRELHGKGLEGVSIRDMVFDCGLELVVGEGLTGDTLELVVG